jgi:hypothetical protein
LGLSALLPVSSALSATLTAAIVIYFWSTAMKTALLEAERNTVRSLQGMIGVPAANGNGFRHLLEVLGETEIFATCSRDFDEMASRYFQFYYNTKSKGNIGEIFSINSASTALRIPLDLKYSYWTERFFRGFPKKGLDELSLDKLSETIPELLKKLTKGEVGLLLSFIFEETRSDPRLLLRDVIDAAKKDGICAVECTDTCPHVRDIASCTSHVIAHLDGDIFFELASEVLLDKDYYTYLVLNQINVLSRFENNDFYLITEQDIYESITQLPESAIIPLKRRLLSLVQRNVDLFKLLVKYGVVHHNNGAGFIGLLDAEESFCDLLVGAFACLDAGGEGVDKFKDGLLEFVEKDILRRKLEDDSIKVRNLLQEHRDVFPEGLIVASETGPYEIPSKNQILFIRENAINALAVEASLSGVFKITRVAQCYFLYREFGEGDEDGNDNRRVVYNVYRMKFFLKLHVSISKSKYNHSQHLNDLIISLLSAYGETYPTRELLSPTMVYSFVDKCVAALRRNPSAKDYYQASGYLMEILQKYRGNYLEFVLFVEELAARDLKEIMSCREKLGINKTAFEKQKDELFTKNGAGTAVFHEGKLIAFAREGEELEIPEGKLYCSLFIAKIPQSTIKLRRPIKTMVEL